MWMMPLHLYANQKSDYDMMIVICWVIFHDFAVFCRLFQNYLLKMLSGTLSECQTVWIQIRTDLLSVLIWVQTVCKGYRQTALDSTSTLSAVLLFFLFFFISQPKHALWDLKKKCLNETYDRITYNHRSLMFCLYLTSLPQNQKLTISLCSTT